MDSNTFFAVPRLARFSRIAGVALLLAAAASVAAASTPDWLKAAAAAPVANYPDNPKAVELLDEQMTTVGDNGEIRTLYRRAYKILRPEGREIGLVAVYFDKETRLTYLKAWSIPPNGKDFEVKEKDAIETSGFGDYLLYQDTRYKVLKIPGSEVGAVVGYEYEQRRRPYILQDSWWFQDRIPVLRARFILRLPKDWEYKSFWSNYSELKPQSDGSNGWTWEVGNLAAIDPEPEMPAWHAVAGHLAVSFYPPRSTSGGSVASSWADVGRWYAQLASTSRQPTPEIKQKVAELVAPPKAATPVASTTTAPSAAAAPADSKPFSPAQMDKLQALANFVQSQIRYVAIEIGIGGYRPHDAGDILSNRYGDCKDKVTLLISMLKEIGVDSYYVLINTDRGVVTPDFTSALPFNHVILAIKLPPDADADHYHAVLSHPRLGQLLFFDPTDPFTPLGYLPAELQSNYGLLVGDQGGELVKLPLLAPALNRLIRSATLNLTPNGGIYGDVQEIRWGLPAEDIRARWLRAPDADRTKLMEAFIGGFLNGFSLLSSKIENLGELEQNLVLHYRFEAPGYAKEAGDLLLLRPRVLGSKSDNTLEVTEGAKTKERKYPVEFAVATLQSDIVEIKLPDGYKVDELPSPLTVDIGHARYRSRCEVDGNVLRYTRLYEIKDVSVPADQINELKRFYRQIDADENSAAILKRVLP